MEYVFFIGVVVLIFVVINLSGRLSRLEKLVREGKGAAQLPSGQSPDVKTGQTLLTPIAQYIAQQTRAGINREMITGTLLDQGWKREDIEHAFSVLSITSAASVPMKTAEAPVEADRFISWIKEDWLLKLGALLILIGFGWFTTYAFLHNWIGPMGRITIGIVAGVLFIVLGWWRMQKYLRQGGVFLVLGSTTILLTTFAARTFYNFFTPATALGLMFLSTVFVALASVKYKSRPLALAGIILAGIAPLLTGGNADYVGLFAYLFVVVLGAVWVVAMTGQRSVLIAALLLITFYSLPHLSGLSGFWNGGGVRDTLLLFAYAFSALFFVTNTAGIVKLRGEGIQGDLITAAGNGLFLLMWIMAVAQKEWQSLIIAAWMVVFSVGAFMVFQATKRKEPFFVYAGIGIAYLAAATAAELDGTTLTIAFTVEAAMIALITYALLKDLKMAGRMTLLMLVPVALSISSITSSVWLTTVIQKEFFVLATLAASLLGLGYYFMNEAKGGADEEENKQYSGTLLVVGSLYVYALIWLSLQAALVNNDTAVMISLFVYTLVGLITYFQGMTLDKKGLRVYGGVLLGLVVARLLFVEVWDMELTWRIITFFAIGALLMATAFFGKKKRAEMTHPTSLT